MKVYVLSKGCYIENSEGIPEEFSTIRGVFLKQEIAKQSVWSYIKHEPPEISKYWTQTICNEKLLFWSSGYCNETFKIETFDLIEGDMVPADWSL